MDWFVENKEIIGMVVGAVLALATVVTGLTSTPIDDTVVDVIKRLVGALGFSKFKDAEGSVKLPGQSAGKKPLFSERK